MSYPLFLIAGPAGVGKTSVVKALLRQYPSLRSSVTFTTRQKREKMSEDKVMHYVSKEEFEQRIDKGEFLEWAIVHGDYYGTHKEITEDLLLQHPVIFNIDVQGAEQIMALYGKRLTSIFLLPESFDQIAVRLRARGEVSEEKFQERLKSAEKELKQQDRFDHKIVNYEGKLDETILKVAEIMGLSNS